MQQWTAHRKVELGGGGKLGDRRVLAPVASSEVVPLLLLKLSLKTAHCIFLF